MCRISTTLEVSSALEKMKIGRASGPSGVVKKIMKADELEMEWPMKKGHESILERTEMRIVRRMCGTVFEREES